MKRMNFPRRKAQRRTEGEARSVAFQALDPTARLARNSTKYAKKQKKRSTT